MLMSVFLGLFYISCSAETHFESLVTVGAAILMPYTAISEIHSEDSGNTGCKLQEITTYNGPGFCEERHSLFRWLFFEVL